MATCLAGLKCLSNVWHAGRHERVPSHTNLPVKAPACLSQLKSECEFHSLMVQYTRSLEKPEKSGLIPPQAFSLPELSLKLQASHFAYLFLNNFPIDKMGK